MTLRCRVTCKGTLGWVLTVVNSVVELCFRLDLRCSMGMRGINIQFPLLSPPQMHLSVKVLIGLCCLGAMVMAQAQYDGDLYAEASQDSSVYTPNRLG